MRVFTFHKRQNRIPVLDPLANAIAVKEIQAIPIRGEGYAPLVSQQDVADHLVILSAMWADQAKWTNYTHCIRALHEYVKWVQYDLAQEDQGIRTSVSTDSGSSVTGTGTGSGTASAGRSEAELRDWAQRAGSIAITNKREFPIQARWTGESQTKVDDCAESHPAAGPSTSPTHSRVDSPNYPGRSSPKLDSPRSSSDVARVTETTTTTILGGAITAAPEEIESAANTRANVPSAPAPDARVLASAPTTPCSVPFEAEIMQWNEELHHALTTSLTGQTLTSPMADEGYLLPTLNVAIAWYAHLMLPAQYAEDLASEDFAILKDKPFPLRQIAQAIQDGTLPLVLPSATKPDLDLVFQNADLLEEARTQLQVALAAAKDFHEGGWFSEAAGLKVDDQAKEGRITTAIARYHAFLELRRVTPTHQLLLPSLDIALAWKTHILHHTQYTSFTSRVFEETITFAPSPEVTSAEKSAAITPTRKLWKKLYGYEYAPRVKGKTTSII